MSECECVPPGSCVSPSAFVCPRVLSCVPECFPKRLRECFLVRVCPRVLSPVNVFGERLWGHTIKKEHQRDMAIVRVCPRVLPLCVPECFPSPSASPECFALCVPECFGFMIPALLIAKSCLYGSTLALLIVCCKKKQRTPYPPEIGNRVEGNGKSS